MFWLNGADIGHANEMTGKPNEMTGHGNEMTGNYIGHGTSGRDFARFAGALLRHTVGNPKEQLKAELVAAFDDGLSHSITGASHQTSSTPSGPA